MIFAVKFRISYINVFPFYVTMRNKETIYFTSEKKLVLRIGYFHLL